MRVIRTRDVIFDKTRFYDFAKIDSSHLLITIKKDTVKILKISNNIFFEIMIQKKDDRDKYVDHLKNESVEKETGQLNKSKNLQIDLKKFLFLTFEKLSKSNQMIFNANIINTISLNIERDILETFIK